MLQQILMALGAGLASGVLFVLPAKGMLLGIWLSVLAPLPLMIAMLGYGVSAGLVASLVGAVLIGLMQPALSLVFLLSSATPSLILGALARYRRAGGHVGPGLLLSAVTVLSIIGSWVMMVMVGVSYGSLETAAAEITGGLEQVLKSVENSDVAPEGVPAADFARMLVISAPAIMSFWSVLVFSLNLWLAGRVVQISGRLERHWPDLPAELALPRVALPLFAAATLACLLPGVWRVVAATAAVALCIAFALQGLAAIHRITRGRKSRAGLLSAVYATILLLFPLPLFIAAGVGIADNVRPLRRPSLKPTSTTT